MKKLKRYFKNLFISLDQLLNTVLGGAPDHTLSYRMGVAIAEGRCVLCRPVCWFLGLFDPGHCEKAREDRRNDISTW